jgi:site-specific recombinase XerD
MSEGIERYATWLHERRYNRAYVIGRVQILFHFAEYAQQRGVCSMEQLPPLVTPFVDGWTKAHHRRAHKGGREALERRTRRPIYACLRLLIPGFQTSATLPVPFATIAPGYFQHLSQQRGLRERTVHAHVRQLGRLETYLSKIGLSDVTQFSPLIISSYVTDRGRHDGPRVIQECCSVLKSFLSYLYREGLLDRDLSGAVEAPRHYRLARVPRSISWADVEQMLNVVDRRAPVGRRDYVILLLLITYGLRAREVAALTLDDFDWKRQRLLVLERKAGHSTAYPLTPTIADAVVDYLKNGRPQSSGRYLFVQQCAPYQRINDICVSQRVTLYLRKAGIRVHRAGSHTLRHSCVQRLVEATLSLKTIGDYVGHRSAASTRVYTKVDIEGLRQVCLGDGEVVL